MLWLGFETAVMMFERFFLVRFSMRVLIRRWICSFVNFFRSGRCRRRLRAGRRLGGAWRWPGGNLLLRTAVEKGESGFLPRTPANLCPLPVPCTLSLLFLVEASVWKCCYCEIVLMNFLYGCWSFWADSFSVVDGIKWNNCVLVVSFIWIEWMP